MADTNVPYVVSILDSVGNRTNTIYPDLYIDIEQGSGNEIARNATGEVVELDAFGHPKDKQKYPGRPATPEELKAADDRVAQLTNPVPDNLFPTVSSPLLDVDGKRIQAQTDATPAAPPVGPPMDITPKLTPDAAQAAQAAGKELQGSTKDAGTSSFPQISYTMRGREVVQIVTPGN